MLASLVLLSVALAAPACDPATVEVPLPTPFDPVGEVVAIAVEPDGATTVVLRLPADHPAVTAEDRLVRLALQGGAEVVLAAGPIGVVLPEMRSALVPGLVEVDLPLALAPDAGALTLLARDRLLRLALPQDDGHAWTIRASSAARLRRAWACAATRAAPR